MAIESNLTRSGQNNNSGSDRALFEKKMQTDVLRYFQATNIGEPLITQKTIENGKSAAFPVVGQATAAYHTVGTELDGQKIAATEREITIDDMLVGYCYIPDLDQAMAHYDANSAYNESIGRALAKRYDQDLFRMVVKAGLIEDSTDASAAGLLAFADDVYTSPVTFATAGDELVGEKIIAKVSEAVQQWVEKDIPGEPVIVLKPASYYSLLNNPANTGLTWVNDQYAQSGKVPTILGKQVMVSPNLPGADDSANTAINSKYRADFTKVAGVMFSKESVGCLKLIGLTMRSDYLPQRLAHLTVGKMAVGFGILNHACSIPLMKA